MTTLKVKKVTPSKKATRNLDAYLLIDSSGSMAHYTDTVRQLIDDQIKLFKSKNKETNTKVSIASFNEKMTWLCNDEPARNLVLTGQYSATGGTALNDSAAQVLNLAGTAPKSPSLLVIITDGFDNSSSVSDTTLKNLIHQAISSDMWTIAVACPPGSKQLMVSQYGIPEGCVTEWAGNDKAIKALSSQITVGTQSLYKNIYRGVPNVKSSYFSPDLNLPVKNVKAALNEVTGSYNIVKVPNTNPDNPTLVISTFCTKKGYKYSAGIAYYQLTKKEKVQDYKNIIIQNKDTNKLYTGDDVRDLLGIPSGGEITLTPATSSKYNIFVRSTSYTRKLVPNTLLLIAKK